MKMNVGQALFLYNGGICTTYDADSKKVKTFDEEG